MPSRELTNAIVEELKSQQIFVGNFYWFEHNWHYIRKWDHLTTEKTLNKLTPAQSAAPPAQLLERCAHYLFRLAVGIYFCIIEEVHACLIGRRHHLHRSFYICLIVKGHPRTER